MASIWDTIKREQTPPLNIANGDANTVYDPVRGAPIRGARAEGLKFKPVNAAPREQVEEPPAVVSHIANVAVENPNWDLVSDDVVAAQFDLRIPKSHGPDGRSRFAKEIKKVQARERAEANKTPIGRPRKYRSDAERQEAYRQRKAAK